ncbi:hypothetical protein SNE40_006973 [Patella caerulea]|uniref:Uncharacterized protein n=1 Tax=Patella caerulea TaxID=87958 RepID=A0AAN8K3Q0_PATCE
MLISQFSLARRHRHRNAAPEICQEPDPSKLTIFSPQYLRSTFYQMPALQNGVNFTDVPRKYRDTKYYKISGPRRCPNEDEMKMTGREVCPVYHTLNVDHNRIPNNFVEAVCSCKSPPKGLLATPIIDCEKQMMYTKVLRRVGCEKGVYVYAEVWEPIRIGCTATINIRTSGDSPKSPSNGPSESSPKSPSNRRPGDSPKSPSNGRPGDSPKSPSNGRSEDSPKSPSNRRPSPSSRMPEDSPKSPSNRRPEDSPKSPSNRRTGDSPKSPSNRRPGGSSKSPSTGDSPKSPSNRRT